MITKLTKDLPTCSQVFVLLGFSLRMPSKSKKKQLAVLATRKKSSKAQDRLNPFEVRVNRKKHDVLGQKSKSDKGLPGVARSKAIKKRQATLLVEYKERRKSNQFVDRRFGEYDEQMTMEDKMMRRFALERKRKHERGGVFNLGDSDNEEGLTHYGRSLGDMDAFDSVQISEDEPEEGDINETHFGGFLRKKLKTDIEESTDKPRTRKEIMNEVVAKSKAMKYKAQSERQNVEELLDKINTDWKEVKELLPSATAIVEERRNADDYDRAVRELAYEKRGQPTDRLKTEAERAKEEKEKLEKLEADRIRRMRGVVSTEEAAAESGDYIAEKSRSAKKVQFTLHYRDGKAVLPDDVIHTKETDTATEEIEEEGSSEEESSEDDCDPGAEYGSDLESEQEEELESDLDQCPGPEPIVAEGGVLVTNELPYTFTVPKDLDELVAIVSGRSPDECVTALERIHSCNHPSINPGNKQLLQDFLPVLLDYCTSLGEHLTSDGLATINSIAGPLFKLAQLNPLHTATVFRERLLQYREEWVTRTKTYPPLSQLLLFKLIALVFPTSDYHHPVATPALVFMGQILAKCQVRTMTDVLSGVLVSHVTIEYISQSKRLVPELVNFLTSLVGCFTESGKSFKYPPFNNKGLPFLKDTNIQDGQSKSLMESFFDPSESLYTVMKSTLAAVEKTILLYTSLPSFSEIFEPLKKNLENVSSSSWPVDVTHLLTNALELLSTEGNRDKPVLQLLRQKPKSIKFYEPKFDQVYEVNRKKARSKSLGEKDKLKHKVKKETKGAIREIRRDTAFLANQQLEEKRQLDAERNAKTKQILHYLEMGQHEAKKERRKRK